MCLMKLMELNDNEMELKMKWNGIKIKIKIENRIFAYNVK